MNFQALAAFQDGLTNLGIGGNDCAVYVDGRPVYRHFSGWQNREEGIPVSENTLYRMFSMTKPLTCAAALQLFERGAFLLNDPLSDYLPEYAHMNVREALPEGSEAVRPAKNALRVQHLFEMSAGLDYDMDAPALRKLASDTQNQFTTRQFAAALSQKPLLFEPGTHWHYSLAHDVLGALIEVISGMTLAEYFEKNIFAPLGIRDAWFVLPKEEEGRICHRYGLDSQTGEWARGEETNRLQPSPNFFSGGAGITMTVDGYAKFACAMTNRGASKDGARILAGRTVDLMRANRLSDAQLRDIWMTDARVGYGYGLGVRTMYDPAMSGSVTPRGEFGWGGAWGTYVLMDPENKVTIVYAEQGVDTKGVYIQRRIRNLAYAALEWEGLL